MSEGSLGGASIFTHAVPYPLGERSDNKPHAKTAVSGEAAVTLFSRLPAPGVADDFDDVAVVVVDQIDCIVDIDPSRAWRRIAQAVGAPVVHLITPEDVRQILADIVLPVPIGARHAVVAVAGREIEADAHAVPAAEALVMAPPVAAMTAIPVAAPLVAVPAVVKLAIVAIPVPMAWTIRSVRTVGVWAAGPVPVRAIGTVRAM